MTDIENPEQRASEMVSISHVRIADFVLPADFGFASSFVVRHFRQVRPHNVFLIGALVGFFCADQPALIEVY